MLSDKPTAFKNSNGQPNGTNRKGRNRRGLCTRAIYCPQQSSGNFKKYRKFTSPVGRCRTATVVTNNQIDALLIQETTDKDTVVVELIIGSLKFYTANMYLDITEKLDKNIELINGILKLANTSGILITMDSNSRSRTWHDKLTNGRGKEIEEFLISKQLFIINEKSEMKTFQSSRGSIT